jgi:membrane fusion protein (multidrug efflux system)
MNYKIKIMQKMTGNILMVSSIAFVLAACGGNAAKDRKGDLGDLKVRLEKKKKEKSEIDAEIRKLEAEIAKADPNAVQAQKLVAVDTLRVRDFAHYVDLQGRIDAEGVAFVSPHGLGGLVKAIYVRTGSRVSKGQLIMKLDDAVAQQQVATARQGISGAESYLRLKQSIYERRQNLWSQGIGSEVDLLAAKTEFENAASALNQAKAAVRLAQENAALSNVYAGISGIVDAMNVRVGEFFSPQSAADPKTGIRIVNNNSVKVITDVPENYIARIKRGDSVLISVPETGKADYKSVINVVGSSIDPTKRSFQIEARLPYDPMLKPNQLASMKILDYKARGIISVPENVVQTDEKGKYVYVIEKTGDRSIVRKKPVIVGESYNNATEIKSGLTGGEVIVTEGYQTVYDGQAVIISK